MNPHPGAVFTIPGMKVGCMPFDAMKESSLECFFSSSCLNETARWISTLPPSEWPQPLNKSSMTSFRSQTLIKDLIFQQMVDQWNYGKDFVGYYAACAPIQCSYTLVRYNSFIYVITLLIGLQGGLTVALRLMAPFIVDSSLRLYRRCKTRKRCRIRPEQGIRAEVHGNHSDSQHAPSTISSVRSETKGTSDSEHPADGTAFRL